MTASASPASIPFSPWSLGAYRRPRLAVLRIDSRSPDTLALVHDGGVTELDVTGIGAADLAARLDRLRDAAAGDWAAIRSASAARAQRRAAGADPDPDGLVDLLDGLDRLGLITETDDGHDVLVADHARLDAALDRAAGWIAAGRREIGGLDHTTMLDLARGLLDRIRDVIAGGGQAGPFAPPPELPQGAGFHATILRLLVEAWAVTAPLSLVATGRLLARLTGTEARFSAPPGCLYDITEAERHLGVAATTLILAGLPGAERRALPPAGTPIPETGIGLILTAEAMTPALLSAIGDDRIGALLAGRDAGIATAIARGVYLAQYHVSARITDIFLPAMRMALRPGLRGRMRRYHVEESGHEAHELEACRRLGLDADAVIDGLPLPPFTAYVDLLGLIADRAPAAFPAVLIVTEGLPGRPNPMNGRLAAAGIAAAEDAEVRAHEQINIGLDHTTMPRRLGAEIPHLGRDDARRALDLYALMVELNARALGWLAAFHGDPARRPVPDWLPVPARDLAGWARDGMI